MGSESTLSHHLFASRVEPFMVASLLFTGAHVVRRQQRQPHHHDSIAKQVKSRPPQSNKSTNCTNVYDECPEHIPCLSAAQDELNRSNWWQQALP